MKKETYKFNYSNAAVIAAAETICIENIDDAGIDGNLPHNQLYIHNGSASVTAFIFLDNASVLTAPDYVLQPNSDLIIDWDDGIHFHHVFVLNTHAADDIAINELKARISTTKEVKE